MTVRYVFLVIVLVPALVEIGLNEIGCHLFVLYWGCLSYITPPVTLEAITAAAMAEADHMSTSFLSMRLGSAKYILPFLFVLNPVMILMGPMGEGLVAAVTAFIGCILLAGSLEGYLYFYGNLSYLFEFSSLHPDSCSSIPTTRGPDGVCRVHPVRDFWQDLKGKASPEQRPLQPQYGRE